MLYTIAVVLIILWLLGLVTSYTIGGFIHILLVVAVIMILLRLLSGRGLSRLWPAVFDAGDGARANGRRLSICTSLAACTGKPVDFAVTYAGYSPGYFQEQH